MLFFRFIKLREEEDYQQQAIGVPSFPNTSNNTSTSLAKEPTSSYSSFLNDTNEHELIFNTGVTPSKPTTTIVNEGVNVIRKTPKKRVKFSSEHQNTTTSILPFMQIFQDENMYPRLLAFLPYSTTLLFSYSCKEFNNMSKKYSPYIYCMNQFIQWYHQVCVVMLTNANQNLQQFPFLKSIHVIARSCVTQLIMNEIFHLNINLFKNWSNNYSTIFNSLLMTNNQIVEEYNYLCIPTKNDLFNRFLKIKKLIEYYSSQNKYFQELCNFLLGKMQIIEMKQVKGIQSNGIISVIQIIPDLQNLEEKVFITQNLMKTIINQKQVIIYQMIIGTNSLQYSNFLGLNSKRMVIVRMSGTNRFEFNELILFKLCQLSGVITNDIKMSVIEMFQFLSICGTFETLTSIINQYINHKKNNIPIIVNNELIDIKNREDDPELKSIDFITSTFLKQYVFDLTNLSSTRIYLLELLINMTNQLLCDIQFIDITTKLLNYNSKKFEYDKIINRITNVFGRELSFKLLGSFIESTLNSTVRMSIEINKKISGEILFNYSGFINFVTKEPEHIINLKIRTNHSKIASLLGIKEDRDVLILSNQTINHRIVKNLSEMLELGSNLSEHELIFFLIACCCSVAKYHYSDDVKTAYTVNVVDFNTVPNYLALVSQYLSKTLQCTSTISCNNK
ncbi:hypothetical protein ABK040_000159 [Willaertia magna]